ncbi:hypothetical protein KAR91_11520 [Candidatus Pacearchaeota archaeon]|nr:hypothetical protein [Candidatus Pacearchaeota archaeon]
MNLVENVYDISEKLLYTEPMNVMLNETKISQLARLMKTEGIMPFPMPDLKDTHKGTLIELVASSINYCYWYGSAKVRPNEINSGAMYEAVEDSFKNYQPQFFMFQECISDLINRLSIERFPLLEDRKRHLHELTDQDAPAFARLLSESKKISFDEAFETLIRNFLGFSSDTFLKRASLFFLQLYRKYGWFAPAMKKLHVPADYQVPKVLKHFMCLYYKSELDEKIKDSELIPKHSLEECQIRAATVLACKMLQEETGWNIADIDGWLWLRRKTAIENFHLTITTDY